MNPCKDWCYTRFGKEYTPECDGYCDYAKLCVELKRAKRERDAVLNAFRGFIQSGHLCEYCAETLKDDPACSACEKWSKFQWRGVGEDT